ncbi:PAS-domain containing protein [Crenobacter sp. SG2303]|uniref:histidine kinase n=1 Tax=Crenobacter oryzisoli TaxID=3056844 RepID=A0ABT7XRR4_9NEIS|nr:PAS-domain containing protein [Crenobacter sp. SG2303]MDN0076482.1 PAS-domain containing protein [Crenobacter sp. SG2303]
MKRLTRFFSLLGLVSVRSRLIATFLLLFSITLGVVAVGVLGLRANQKALDEYEAYVVPEIARVLELSEKVAQLAAVAPGMTLTENSTLLHDDTALLKGLLGDIRRLSLDLTDKGGQRLAISEELDGIDNDLTRFLVLSGKQRQLRAEMGDLGNAAEQIGAGIYRRRAEIAQTAPTLLNVWVNTTLGLQAGDRAALGMAEGDNEALWLQVTARGEQLRQPQLAAALRQLDEGPRNVFDLRREFLSTEDQISYLVALMRSHAEHLSSNAAHYVDELRSVARQRREAMRQVAISSQYGLWVLAMAGVALALAGIIYVGRVLHKIQAMTRIMARLASGDTSHRIPSTDRPDEIGELARAFEVFRSNLLEKHQLAQWLEAQRRQQETVFNSMNDGVSVHDAQGCLVAWNPTFVKLLGLPDSALCVGMCLAELRRAVPAPARWRAVSRQTATRIAGGATRIASSAELHLADQRILEFHCQRLPGGGWVAVSRDLTSRRAVEAELRQAQKMDVLGQLTGGVAHDFNNFLVAILGNLELLQPRLVDSPELQVMAERARRAAERASRLTRRLLAFARRQPLQAEDISVPEMLAEMLDLVEYAAGTNIEVVLAPCCEPLWVHVDRGQLENAILNLSLNSAAAMPAGGRLTLAAEWVEAPPCLPGVERAVVLSVSDTGTGIPPMLLDKVMEPFFTTKAPGEGSGLGLSSVYGFVRQSGGDMQIHSTLGQGTRVELWLPAVSLPAVLSPVRPKLQAPPPPGARVLVVEDDPEVRDTTLSQLAALGVAAQAVDSSTAALEWLSAYGPVALVLSDISLGAGGNGIALAAQVRRSWPGQRVVLTSGLPQEVHQSHPDWRQDQLFLAKPFDLAALAGLLS